MPSIFRSFPLIVIISTLLLIPTPPGFSQEETIPIPAPATSEPVLNPTNGLYFADILVRGRPIFQVGSLADLSAEERAEIINRRIASILAQVEDPEPVTMQVNEQQGIAVLQVNNRVIMTVTEQDAEDFGLTLQELAEKWANQLNQVLEKPALAVDVGQRLYGTIQQLIRNTIDNVPSIIGAFIVIILTWVIAIIARRGFILWAERTEGDSSTELLIGRLGYGGVWLIGSIIALGVLGIDFGGLLGALGLTSVAIGFSLKDVLSNYISGIILLAARPFKIQDQVVIGDYEGTVIQINLRATTMRTYDGRMVYIPNQDVFGESVINNTASPRRRSSVIVGIDYEADISQAKQVILEALRPAMKVESKPKPEVLVKELAPSTVNLEVRFWVNSQQAGFLETTSEAMQAIKEGLEKAGLEMPTDIYTLMFRNSPLETKEENNNSDKAVQNSELK